MTIQFHEDAEKELQDAVRYYSEISWTEVANFDSEIKSVLATITKNPRRYHLTRDRKFRRANLRQFPYRILCDVNEGQSVVRIVIVCHQKRHPSHGLNRT